MNDSCLHQNNRKHGFYKRKCDGRRVQRFLCLDCGQGYSTQTNRLSYRSKMPWLDRALLRLLCSGVSQRRCAENFGIKLETVAKKVLRYAGWANKQARTLSLAPSTVLMFDDMETFEHSKCKPLSIALAVEEASRRILSIQVSSMPAKGKLAEISKKKYGYRPDHRKKGWEAMFLELKTIGPEDASSLRFKSDENPHYPRVLRKFFPTNQHQAFQGRRGCVVGQGELKRGGFDPLFALNHTCAMIRDNLKTLARRTWCTTKKPCRLQALLDIYRWYHNQVRLKNPAALQS